jgi:hypothetical protein
MIRLCVLLFLTSHTSQLFCSRVRLTGGTPVVCDILQSWLQEDGHSNRQTMTHTLEHLISCLAHILNVLQGCSICAVGTLESAFPGKLTESKE